jgi:hypothetical protein
MDFMIDLSGVVFTIIFFSLMVKQFYLIMIDK